MKWFILGMLSLQLAQADWKATEQQVVQEILPTEKESAWLQIPWRTNLWEARKEAAKLGKPIYLWEMDGHPLGCT